MRWKKKQQWLELDSVTKKGKNTSEIITDALNPNNTYLSNTNNDRMMDVNNMAADGKNIKNIKNIENTENGDPMIVEEIEDNMMYRLNDLENHKINDTNENEIRTDDTNQKENQNQNQENNDDFMEILNENHDNGGGGGGGGSLQTSPNNNKKHRKKNMDNVWLNDLEQV